MGRLTGDKTGDRTLVQETVDFVLRWDWEMGDRRQEKADRRRERGYRRQETRDRR